MHHAPNYNLSFLNGHFFLFMRPLIDVFKNVILHHHFFTVFLGYFNYSGGVSKYKHFIPLKNAQKKQNPTERLPSIRLALFVTFAFCGISHLINENKIFYPIHFLRTFLYSLSFMGWLTYFQLNLSSAYVSVSS